MQRPPLKTRTQVPSDGNNPKPADPPMNDSPSADDTSTKPTGSPVDPKLLDILVCPLSKSPLRYDRQRQELISDQAGLAYPIRDGIPIMLVDEARTLGEDEAIPEQVKPGAGPDAGSEQGAGS